MFRGSGLRVLAQLRADGEQAVPLRRGGVIAAQQHRVHRFAVETQHIVFAEIRFDEDVALADVLVERVRAEHRDELSEDVADVVDLLVVRTRVGELDADQVVHPDRPGDIRREIIAHAAVHQHHPPGAHRVEEAGNRHGRTHRRGDGAAAPVLRLRADHVARHADVRHRQPREGNTVLEAHGHAGQQIVDIEAVRVSRREGIDQAGRPGARRAAIFDLAADAIAEAVFHLIRLPGRVVEREGKQVGRARHLDRIGNEFRRHAVGQHHAPVLAEEEFFQIRGAVAHGIEAAHQAADAGAADEVDGDAEFLDIFERAHLGGSLRAAAGEHHAHDGALLRIAYAVELLADLADHDGVRTRIHAVRRQAVGVGLRLEGADQQER